MIVVAQLTMITCDRPTQWEGSVGDKGSIYIRYRWGNLEAYVSADSRDPLNDGIRVFDARVGGKYEGRMTTEEMKTILVELCIFKD